VHLDTLSEFMKFWDKEQAESISSYDDLERGEYVVELRPCELDLRVALIAGDFVCCLRSSLDHLAWQLAALNANGIPSNKRISFPIQGVNTLDSQIEFTKSTFGISEEAIAYIRSLQPYQSGERYRLHYLWVLNTLWNIDKHRHIPLHTAVTEYNLAPGSAMPIRDDKFHDHMKIFFRLADKSNVKLDPLPKSEIIFGDQQEGVATIHTFREIYEFVTEKIIPNFSRFFE